MDDKKYKIMHKMVKDISGLLIDPSYKDKSFRKILEKIKEDSNDQYKKIYNRILQNLALNIPLYKILFEEGYLNNAILLTLIFISEKQGKLPEAFILLNNFFEYNDFLHKRISRLIYNNLILLSTFLIYLFIFFIFIFPHLADFANRFNIHYQGLFHNLEKFSDFLQSNISFIIIIVSIIVFFLIKLLSFYIKNKYAPIKKLKIIKSIKILFDSELSADPIIDLKTTIDSIENLRGETSPELKNIKDHLLIIRENTKADQESIAMIINNLHKKQLNIINSLIQKATKLLNFSLFFIISSTFLFLIYFLSKPLINIFNIVF